MEKFHLGSMHQWSRTQKVRHQAGFVYNLHCKNILRVAILATPTAYYEHRLNGYGRMKVRCGFILLEFKESAYFGH